MIDSKGYFGVACNANDEAEIISSLGMKILNFNGVSCKAAKMSEGNFCESFESYKGSYLPWMPELYAEGGEVRANLLGSYGVPLWTVTCKFAGVKKTDECKVNTSVHMTNNTSTGTVEAAFDTKSNKVWCAFGGTEGGEWKGTLKIKATSKEVEAIKVE